MTTYSPQQEEQSPSLLEGWFSKKELVPQIRVQLQVLFLFIFFFFFVFFFLFFVFFFVFCVWFLFFFCFNFLSCFFTLHFSSFSSFSLPLPPPQKKKHNSSTKPIQGDLDWNYFGVNLRCLELDISQYGTNDISIDRLRHHCLQFLYDLVAEEKHPLMFGVIKDLVLGVKGPNGVVCALTSEDKIERYFKGQVQENDLFFAKVGGFFFFFRSFCFFFFFVFFFVFFFLKDFCLDGFFFFFGG